MLLLRQAGRLLTRRRARQLSEYTQDVRRFTGSIFDASDRHFQNVAGYIKRSVPHGWLPEVARPAPPPPPRVVSGAYIHRLQDWISRNRALTAAVVAFFATGGVMLWREQNKSRKKRRARRASNGARKEVVGTASGNFAMRWAC